MMSTEGNFQAKEITEESLHILFNDPCTERKAFCLFQGGGGTSKKNTWSGCSKRISSKIFFLGINIKYSYLSITCSAAKESPHWHNKTAKKTLNHGICCIGARCFCDNAAIQTLQDSEGNTE